MFGNIITTEEEILAGKTATATLVLLKHIITKNYIDDERALDLLKEAANRHNEWFEHLNKRSLGTVVSEAMEEKE